LYHLNDDIFEERFRNCSLEPSLFTHEAHLRLAYIHIRKYGEDKAIQNLCLQIAIYDRTHDEGKKFHHTITVVAVKIVYHFIRKSRTRSFRTFLTEFPQLNTNFRGLVSQHYSIDLFKHPTARIAYIEPDLKPFGRK
jgi:hypothetical protein